MAVCVSTSYSMLLNFCFQFLLYNVIMQHVYDQNRHTAHYVTLIKISMRTLWPENLAVYNQLQNTTNTEQDTEKSPRNLHNFVWDGGV